MEEKDLNLKEYVKEILEQVNTKEDVENRITICPFCGSDNIYYEKGVAHCCDCMEILGQDEVLHEELRQKISCACSGECATEDNPIDCENGSFDLTIGHAEAMGLSELQMPTIQKIFHDPEGIVWVQIEGEIEPRELDDLDTSDLSDIVEWLSEEGYL